MATSDARDIEVAKTPTDGSYIDGFPLWKLCLVATPQFGIQCFWTFMGAAIMPYLSGLGFPNWALPLLTFAGPITGFFTDPIVGTWSDHSTSRFGRRRPVILAGFTSTFVVGLMFAAVPRVFSGAALFLSTGALLWVLDTTINLMQTPIRALVSDLSSDHQSTAAQVIVTVFQGLGSMASFSIQTIWENPADHILEMFAMMIAINGLCVGLMLLVTTEVPLEACSKNSGQNQSVLAPIIATFQSLVHVPKFLMQLGVIQTLVWCGIGMLNKNGSLWFAITLFHGRSTALTGSPEKVAFDHGIEAYSTAGVFQSVFMIVASVTMFVILLKTRLSLRYLYAFCLFAGGCVAFLAYFAVGNNVVFAQALVVLAKIAETSTFVVPYALVVIANKAAEMTGAEVNTAMQMSLLNCYCTMGQLLSMAFTSLFFAAMPASEAIPATFLLGALCQLLSATGALALKSIFSPQSCGGETVDRKVTA